MPVCVSVIAEVYLTRATHGVTVSTSAFLMLLCGFESRGLNPQALVCGYFLKLIVRGFLWVLRFPPLLHRFNGSASKIKLK